MFLSGDFQSSLEFVYLEKVGIHFYGYFSMAI